MPDLVTQTPDQLQRATAAPETALTIIQQPGGPVQAIEIQKLIGALVKADVVASTVAGLTLNWADGSIGYAYAPVAPDIAGYYLKSGAIGGGAWTFASPGSTGLSAYQIWLQAGNVGSEADFLASLVGVISNATMSVWLDGLPSDAPSTSKAWWNNGGIPTRTP